MRSPPATSPHPLAPPPAQEMRHHYSPASGDEPPWRRSTPRPKLREPWEEEAGALLRRLHEGRYLPGPDFSSTPHAVLPDTVKAAAERFGHDNQVVAK